jgi:hypothetical protein
MGNNDKEKNQVLWFLYKFETKQRGLLIWPIFIGYKNGHWATSLLLVSWFNGALF